MKRLGQISARTPPALKAIVASVFSLMAGVAVALVFDYLLYRMGMPSKPFIYVSF
jgi:hypothetical protein